MPREPNTPLNVDLPPNLRPQDPEFVQLLNERLRTLARNADQIDVRAHLDMRGFRILNVGDHQVGGDALSRSAGDRRYLTKGQAPTQTTVVTGDTGGAGSGAGAEMWIRAINGDDALAVGIDVQDNHREITLSPGEHVELRDWSARGKIAPQGDDVIVDALVSSDNALTWRSLFPPDAMIRVAQGSTFGHGATFAVPQLYNGEIIRFDIVQVGSLVAGGQFEFVLRGLIV